MHDPQFWLSVLCCPQCRQDLTLTPQETDSDGHLLSGTFTCTGCAAIYPLRGGIPRFAEEVWQDSVQETVQGFGYQWQKANILVQNTRMSSPDLFLDFVHPVTQDYIAGKLVLDGGCGQGRFTRNAQRLGARAVVGIDLSESVEAAFANTRHLPNVLIVQGDLMALPFKPVFEYVFSVGVLHHTSAPRRAFDSLVGVMTPGGGISAWVYGRENNSWIIRFLNPIRTAITSRLPRPVLWFLAPVLTIPMFLLIKLVYQPIERTPALQGIGKRLFYFEYLCWLGKYCNFREQALVVFDHLVPQIAEYIPRDEFSHWFSENKLQNVVITSRSNNSWRGFGIRKNSNT